MIHEDSLSHAVWYIRLEKKKWKNAWPTSKFIVLSFWMINCDTVFDDLFVSLFAFTILKEVCNSSDKNPNENIWIRKITIFKTANSAVKTVRVEKRDNRNWSKMRWFSFQKIDLHFDQWNPGPSRPILRDIRGQNNLPVINAIKGGSTFKHHIHENGSTIDFFFNFLMQALTIWRNWYDKHCGRILFLL